jgi:hypothetical protein
MIMKKLFLLALAVIPFAFYSCDAEKEGEEEAVAVIGLEGTWYFEDTHHPFTISFKGETYIFETTGFKDQGTFTYENNIITCHLTDRWMGNVEWVDGKRVNTGWEKTDLDGYNGRTFEVSLLENGICVGTLQDDYYGGDPIEIMLVCKEAKITLDASALNGEWLFKQDGKLRARLVVDGNNYTIWQVRPDLQELAVTKEEGQWTYSNGYINLTPTSRGYSFQNGVSGGYVYAQVDPATLEATEWHFAQYELDEMKVPAYKSNDTFYLSISEDQIVYKFKKN